MPLCFQNFGTFFHTVSTIHPIPVPQFLNDVSISPKISIEQMCKLERIKYSNRFALCCFYNENLEFPTDHVAGYTYPGTIRYWAIDNQKRNVDETTSITVHTMTDYRPDSTKEEIVSELFGEFKTKFPKFRVPSEVIAHKWKYSQPICSMENSPG